MSILRRELGKDGDILFSKNYQRWLPLALGSALATKVLEMSDESNARFSVKLWSNTFCLWLIFKYLLPSPLCPVASKARSNFEGIRLELLPVSDSFTNIYNYRASNGGISAMSGGTLPYTAVLLQNHFHFHNAQNWMGWLISEFSRRHVDYVRHSPFITSGY